jgi:hypothetical protein
MTTTRDSFSKEPGWEWMGCLSGFWEKTSEDPNGSKMVDSMGPAYRTGEISGKETLDRKVNPELRCGTKPLGGNGTSDVHSRELLKSSPYRVSVKANEEVISSSCFSAFDAQFGLVLQQHARDSTGTQVISHGFPTV